MPFCANCGTNATGAFCPNCGTPIAAPPPNQGYAPPSGQYNNQSNAQAPAGLSDNAASALCYLLGFITGILFLVMAPYNTKPNVKFHAWQSILFSVAWVIFSIAVQMVLGTILTMLHLWGLTFALSSLVSLAGFCFWLFLMFKAYQNEPFEIPVIGSFARQQAGL